jgi:4-aminobutyrate aminotransferase/(S)-3-amino-2-methylpropionate transaminase
MVERLRDRLEGAATVRELRGAGMMIALELDAPGRGAELMDKLRAEGVIALASGMRGESLTLTPALNIPEADWESLATVLARILR